jgi:hypothetical protein
MFPPPAAADVAVDLEQKNTKIPQHMHPFSELTP